MSRFASGEDLTRVFGALFGRLGADPARMSAIGQPGISIRFEFREPDARLTVVLPGASSTSSELQWHTRLEPTTVVLKMSAEVAHRFWLGRVNVLRALSEGVIEGEGDLLEALSILPHLEGSEREYLAVLSEVSPGVLD